MPIDDQQIGELIGSVKALEKRLEDYIRTFERTCDLMRADSMATVQAIKEAVSDRFAEQKTRLDKHNDRLGALENWRNYLAGIQAALAIAWAWFLAQLRGGGK